MEGRGGARKRKREEERKFEMEWRDKGNERRYCCLQFSSRLEVLPNRFHLKIEVVISTL